MRERGGERGGERGRGEREREREREGGERERKRERERRVGGGGGEGPVRVPVSPVKPYSLKPVRRPTQSSNPQVPRTRPITLIKASEAV